MMTKKERNTSESSVMVVVGCVDRAKLAAFPKTGISLVHRSRLDITGRVPLS